MIVMPSLGILAKVLMLQVDLFFSSTEGHALQIIPADKFLSDKQAQPEGVAMKSGPLKVSQVLAVTEEM